MAAHHAVIAFVLILSVCCCMFSFCMGQAIERRRSVDYKKRWQECLEALDQVFEGKTPKQEVIAGMDSRGLPPAQMYNARPSQQKGSIPLDQATLNKLSWWDRRDMEIERAKKGLLPLDDLKHNMPSFAVKEIIQARIKHGTQK